MIYAHPPHQLMQEEVRQYSQINCKYLVKNQTNRYIIMEVQYRSLQSNSVFVVFFDEIQHKFIITICTSFELYLYAQVHVTWFDSE